MPNKRYCLHHGCGEPLVPQYQVLKKNSQLHKKALRTGTAKVTEHKRKK